MTIGTGTFAPTPRFAYPRSYVYEFCFARYGDTLTVSGNQITVHAVPPDPTIAIMRFDARFLGWSSNRWTNDHIVTDWYALVGGVPPQVPLNYALTYRISPLTGRPCLAFEWFTGSPDFQTVPLPAQPLNYWLPRPL